MAFSLCLPFLALVISVLGHKAGKVQTNVALRSKNLANAHGAANHSRAPHKLRVCNAYPYEAALDILLDGTKITADKPLLYKDCADFKPALKVGDKLEFKIGEASTGTFSVSDLPTGDDARLLLVIYRHDVESTTVAFESHVFHEEQESPQVAIIDTYLGDSSHKLQIHDGHHAEQLRFGRVIAISPGKYDMNLLADDSTEKQASAKVFAENKQSYVVMRVGVKAKGGPSFPEELVSFPKSEEKSFMMPAGLTKSGAASSTAVVPLAVAMVASLMQ
eukprot:TRINITY_DN111568_c0_g1_i1.p1 TRINITY_DN111568_c0_g1~~TRINITY_DN111568_c0_g1_i1.p1  ORF type:complete len:297 (-),score=69.11 TRINITY_DN111568_c0_g1_i1:37-864(-)